MEFSKYSKNLFFCLIGLGVVPLAYAYNKPALYSFSFTKNPVFDVYYKEPAEIPIFMSYNPGNTGMGQWHYWVIPHGYLQNISNCDIPLISGGWKESKLGSCTIKLVLPTNQMNAVYQGAVSYGFTGKSSGGSHSWSYIFTHKTTQPYYVKVIPHPIQLDIIPEQEVLAKTPLTINLKNRIQYFDENVLAGDKPTAWVTEGESGSTLEKLGLTFNPETLTITGAANQTGLYHFHLHAKSSAGTLAARDFTIKINKNPKDTPIFRENLGLTAASPGQPYDFDLLALLKDNSTFMQNNEVSFSIDESAGDYSNSWFRIENGTRLVGKPAAELAGQEVIIPLIAHSNTGGDSSLEKLKLQIASDPAMKPVIATDLKLTTSARAAFNEDLRSVITNPVGDQDPSLKVVIDQLQSQCLPDTPCDTAWLKVSRNQPTMLEGLVPEDATGREYLLTLHANNQMGGDSEKQLIKIQVDIDSARTPRFKRDNPVLPLLQQGIPFTYDFVLNRDVYPEYEDAPYNIAFAEDYPHPSWLYLKDNQLIAESDKIPQGLEKKIIIYVVIKNIPGGESDPISLTINTQ